MQNIIEKLPENWEAELEAQLLLKQRERCKIAYVCSPCCDGSKRILHQNMRAARFYMRCILHDMHIAARAPHAYMPPLFSDTDYAERALAMMVGIRLLETSSFLFICGDRITSGMRGEIEHAAKLGMPITVFNRELFLDVKKIVTRMGAEKGLVCYEQRFPLLACSTRELFQEELPRYA